MGQMCTVNDSPNKNKCYKNNTETPRSRSNRRNKYNNKNTLRIHQRSASVNINDLYAPSLSYDSAFDFAGSIDGASIRSTSESYTIPPHHYASQVAQATVPQLAPLPSGSTTMPTAAGHNRTKTQPTIGTMSLVGSTSLPFPIQTISDDHDKTNTKKHNKNKNSHKRKHKHKHHHGGHHHHHERSHSTLMKSPESVDWGKKEIKRASQEMKQQLRILQQENELLDKLDNGTITREEQDKLDMITTKISMDVNNLTM